ncbi:sialate:O-sulfotransferase 2-like [Ptychodera flava]|uniref:sialate:O-sulfotransferase 2-like n=1 Tax=Ptychodera flava TaxID=63121 RepID=UPI00396A370E
MGNSFKFLFFTVCVLSFGLSLLFVRQLPIAKCVHAELEGFEAAASTPVAKLTKKMNGTANEHTGRLDCPVTFPNWTSSSRPLVALASFPGSGNTWTRFLLEVASGFYTGAVYNDKKLYEGGFVGEMEDYKDGRLLVVKTHATSSESPEFGPAILLIRNPYDAVISEFTRIKTRRNHTGVLQKDSFKDEDWDRFALTKGNSWESFNRSWLNRKNRICVVHYEKLVKDVIFETQRMMTFLNETLTSTRLRCLETHNEGLFHRFRNHSGSASVDVYSKSTRAAMNKHISGVNSVLKQLGEDIVQQTI